MADNFSQGKPHKDDNEFASPSYSGPGRNISSSSDSGLPLHNSGQLDDTASPTKQTPSDASKGKSSQGVSNIIGTAAYRGPGSMSPRNVGETSNQPK